MPHAFKYEHLIATTQDWPEPGVLFRDISPLLAQRFPETIDALADLIINVHPQDAPPIPSPFTPPYFPPYGGDKGGQGEGRVGDLSHIDAFAGVDARGFIFAAALAQKFGKNFVMVRKGGKLPPPSLRESCTLEYGTATFEMKSATLIDTSVGKEQCHPREGGDPENNSNWIPAFAGMTADGLVQHNKSRAPRIVILDDVLATGGTLRAAADLCARAGYEVVGLATLVNLKFLNDFEWNGLKVNAVVEYE